MKRRFILMLAIMVGLFLVGCGSTDTADEVQDPEMQQTQEQDTDANAEADEATDAQPETDDSEASDADANSELEADNASNTAKNDAVNNNSTEKKPAQQASQSSQPSQPSSKPSKNTYTLDGMELEYGVMYLNVCGNNLTGKHALTRTKGPCPYPLGQMIDNGDGTYTVYIIGSHGYFIDGQFYIHDTSPTGNVWRDLELQGYDVSYVGGSSWHACVGGYDEGCIKKLIVK